MTYNVYCVRDRKSSYYMPELYMSDALAIRSFAMRAAVPDSMLGFSPDDFDLYAFGTFDVDKGMFNILPLPEHVCSLNDAIDMYSRGV